MDFKTLIFNRISNMNKRKLGIIIIILLVSILILFPFIDTNFFYSKFYDLANAMGILQISYLNSLGETSAEDKFWLTESEKGLRFSTPHFWKSII